MRHPAIWRWWTSVSHRAPCWTAALRVHSPPTHPTQLSDGGDTGVGGVRSHQTQDTSTEANSPTASRQTHDVGSGANTTPVYDKARNAWVVPSGWIANGAGGWTSPDGAYWGARERPPLKLANDDKWSQHRALEKREERLRHSNGDHNGSYAFDEEDDGITTPQQRKADHEEWYTKRYMEICTRSSVTIPPSRNSPSAGTW